MSKKIKIAFNNCQNDLVIQGYSVDDINKMLSSWPYGEKPIDVFCEVLQRRFLINPTAVMWIRDADDISW